MPETIKLYCAQIDSVYDKLFNMSIKFHIEGYTIHSYFFV